MSKKKASAGEISFRPYFEYFVLTTIFAIFLTLGLIFPILLILKKAEILIAILLILLDALLIGLLGWSSYRCYTLSALRITVNTEIITVENIRQKETVTTEWKAFYAAYALKTSNYRGLLYLVLSKEPLNDEEQRNNITQFLKSKNPLLSDKRSLCFMPVGHYEEIKKIIQNKIPVYEKGTIV